MSKTSLYACRREGVELFLDGGQNFLKNTGNGQAYKISPETAYVLASCDGMSDFYSPAFLPIHRSVLDRLLRIGLAFRCPRGFSGREPDIDGAHWAITGRCNMRCRHCYMGAPVGQMELEMPQMLKILDALCTAGVNSVELTGGEPFLRRDLPELLEEIRKRGITVSDIYTNATLITDETISLLRAVEDQPTIHVSFDGTHVHDRMRGVHGAEEMTLNGVKKLISAGFTVEAATSVDENTLPELMNTYETMCMLGVSAWGVGRPVAAGCARSMERLPNAPFAIACEDLLSRWQSDGKPFTLGLEAFYSERVPFEGKLELLPFAPELFACESCRRYPHIDCHGVLMPCALYAETSYASSFPVLWESDWWEAWHNPALRQVMDLSKGDVLEHQQECISCQHLDQCRTGCRANAQLCGNGLTGRDEIICSLFQNGYKDRFELLGGK